MSTFIREKQPFLKKVVSTSSAIKEDKTSQTKEKYVFKERSLFGSMKSQGRFYEVVKLISSKQRSIVAVCFNI